MISIWSLVYTISFLLENQLLESFCVLSIGYLALIAYFYHLNHPEKKVILQKTIAEAHQLTSKLENVDVDAAVQKLKTAMEKDLLFLDDELDLKSLSTYLALTPHQLSEIINKKMHVSFRTYLNTYRVEESKRLFCERPERTILDVAFASGFHSRSAFNASFSKLVGMSPKEYRQNLGKADL